MSEELKPPYRCKVCNKMIERAFAPLEPTELFKKFGDVKAVQLWEEQLAENAKLQAELEQAKSERDAIEHAACDDISTIKRLQAELEQAKEREKLRRQHEDADVERDSVVASCNCDTKTNEVKYHKPGCKYRLISERDEARARLATAEAELKAYREGGLTEEILRRNDGYIKVGKGCAITLEAKEKE